MLLASLLGAGTANAGGLNEYGDGDGRLPTVIRSPRLHTPRAMTTRPAPAATDATLAFTLDFQPNGEGVEVDAPAGIAFSPDGQYVIVPAAGKASGMAVLSVYRASDLAPVRTIPLTHSPKAAFALMRTQPRAVLVNPDADSVTGLDYETGV